jgi:hypothetical protein
MQGLSKHCYKSGHNSAVRWAGRYVPSSTAAPAASYLHGPRCPSATTPAPLRLLSLLLTAGVHACTHVPTVLPRGCTVLRPQPSCTQAHQRGLPHHVQPTSHETHPPAKYPHPHPAAGLLHPVSLTQPASITCSLSHVCLQLVPLRLMQPPAAALTRHTAAPPPPRAGPSASRFSPSPA